jgi:hypothetical protein
VGMIVTIRHETHLQRYKVVPVVVGLQWLAAFLWPAHFTPSIGLAATWVPGSVYRSGSTSRDPIFFLCVSSDQQPH